MSSGESFFNIADYVYIFFMLASSVFGFLKGLIRTLFSLFAWIGSGFISAAATPYVGKFLEGCVSDLIIRQLIASVGSYILCLILLTMVSYLMSDAVKKSVFGGLDRSLGLLFGFIRGLCIPTIVVITLLALNIPKKKFEIVNNSKISAFLYQSLDGMIPIFNIPALKKQDYKLLKKCSDCLQHKMNVEKEAKKAAMFKIVKPKHNGLSPKIIKKIMLNKHVRMRQKL